MSTSRKIDKICIVILAAMLLITVLFMNGKSLGIQGAERVLGYETRLFDTSSVHRIDLVMDDWDSFIETCENEEYSSCTVVIDGEKYKNVGIRAKGNTSLSSVRQMGSQRYSFKLEFDQYESGKSYYGLDKLCLNNLIQDNTMMKDYLVYRMMADFGADAPLCSYVYITVNGEDWGLYLAVEGLEDGFLQRTYGSAAGDLYKPDSMSFGGGRGNGKDFNMDDFQKANEEDGSDGASGDDAGDGGSASGQSSGNGSGASEGSAGTGAGAFAAAGENGTEAAAGDADQMPGGFPGGFPGGDGQMPGGFPGGFPGGDGQMPDGFPGGDGQMPDGFPGGDGQMPDGFPGGFADGTEDSSQSGGTDAASGGAYAAADGTTDGAGRTEASGNGQSQRRGFGGFGMGSDDVKLKYIDDDPDSYSNIFNNAKTDVTKADQNRLIAALKNLSAYTDLENTLDMEEVLRYFVVHNFVCNGDSYTGAMIHNYYLHESEGRLSMIPWDYNLAFGTFQSGNASESVNASIDEPVSGGSVDDRPMVGWIFSDEKYTGEYHRLFEEFLERWFGDGQLESLIRETAEMIRPYVEKDPTKFCTTEEFDAGIDEMSSFVSLRAEAVSRQLQGDETAVETEDLNLSDMGSMGMGGGNGGPGGFGGFDMSSMFTVTDQSGYTVSLTDLVGDIRSIASVGLSDGTTVDVSGGDFRTLLSIDFSSVVSATDQDGKVTDLSQYTISVQRPGRSGTRSGFGGSGGSGGSGGFGDNGNGAPAETSDAGVSAESSADISIQNSAGAPADNNAGASAEDNTGASAEDNTGASAETGSGTVTAGASGEADGTALSGESAGVNAQQSSGNDYRRMSGMPSGMPGMTGMPGGQQQDNTKTTWILVGASAAILVLGLMIAIRKKW